MAFNGSGTFVRVYSWQTDKANGIKIRADRMDGEDDGFATGLSTCVTRDGQSPATADLPMATFKHTGVGAASARTDYLRASQAQDNDLTYFTTAGTINAYTLTPSPAITSLAAGQEWLVKIHAACAAAPTLAVSGLTAATIVYADGTAVPASGLVTDGQYRLRYDGTNYRVNLVASSTLGLADGGEQTSGFTAASNTRYVCRFGASGTITLPAAPSVTDVIALALAGNYVYTLGRNGLNINSLAADLPVGGNQTLVIEYTGATDGWV